MAFGEAVEVWMSASEMRVRLKPVDNTGFSLLVKGWYVDCCYLLKTDLLLLFH